MVHGCDSRQALKSFTKFATFKVYGFLFLERLCSLGEILVSRKRMWKMRVCIPRKVVQFRGNTRFSKTHVENGCILR